MAQLTRSGRLVLDRLVEYLGAEVERDGRSVGIYDCGDGKGMGELGPLWTDTWGAVGHLLTVATMLEPGGMGCTWQGIQEAVAFEFMYDRDNELQWPVRFNGTVDAQMCRLSEAELMDDAYNQMVAHRVVAT